MRERTRWRAPLRFQRAAVWVAAVAVLVLLASVTPSPYAVERPGPVVDALGTIQTETGTVPVLRIDGAESAAAPPPLGAEADPDVDAGALNILSVSISGTPGQPLDWVSLAGSLLDPASSRVPLSTLYPSGVSAEEREAQNAALMQASQRQAVAAALSELGRPVPVTLRVSRVDPSGPAAGLLLEGDIIRGAAGRELSGLAELRSAVGETGAASPLVLELEREDEVLEARLEPRAVEGAGLLLGIEVTSDYVFPVDVEMQLDRIGGPSAGLIFALAVIDRLTPGELTHGLRVSGTGTIDELGRVGAIGGLRQKLWGAARADSELILVPRGNCAELPEEIPGGLRVAAVGSLAEARAALERAAGPEPWVGVDGCPSRAASAAPAGSLASSPRAVSGER